MQGGKMTHARYLLYLCMRFITMCDQGAGMQRFDNATIISSPPGTAVSGSNNTFVYPIMSSVTLTCTPGPPPISTVNYAWMISGCTACFPNGVTEQNATTSSLTPDDAGTFTCSANAGGSLTSSDPFTLRVSYAPSNVTATVLSSRSVEVMWNAFSTSSGVTGYFISYTTTASYTSGGNETVNDVSTASYTLSNLEEYTNYTITVRATSNSGMSDDSDRVLVKTYTAPPSSPPQNVMVTSLDRASLNVTWEPIPPIDENGPNTGYLITYHITGDQSVMSHVAAETNLTIPGLNPYVNYSVQVAARNINGSGSFSSIITQLSGQDLPTAPRSLSVNNVDDNTITLSWMEPNMSNGIIISYQLEYKIVDSDDSFVSVNSTSLMYTVTGSTPRTGYQFFRAAAYTRVGRGPYSSILVLALTDPTNVNVTVDSSRSIMLTWEQPSIEEENGLLLIIIYHVIVIETQIHYTDVGEEIRGIERYLNRTYNVSEGREQLIGMLHPDYNYTVSIAAATEQGMGPFSDPITVRTNMDVPTAAPRNVSVTVNSSHSIMLTWERPLVKEQNGLLLIYHVIVIETQIHYTDDGVEIRGIERYLNRTYNVSEGREQFIEMLHPDYNYTVSIAAATEQGIGPFSDPITVRTNIDVPTPTVSVTALSNQTVGQSLTLQCEVTIVRGITSRVDIVWSSGVTVLQRMNNVSSTMMNNSLVYTNSYTISQLSTTDDGRVIQCEVVINVDQSVMANNSITLDVTALPQIYVHPLDRTIKVDNDSTSVTFTCMAYDASSYYWQRETGDIPSNSERINTTTLTLNDILPPDSGRYRCVAENEHGTTHSNYAVFIVEAVPPVVHILPEEVQVRKGVSVQFVCSATGVGADSFVYQWFLNDLPVADQDTSTLIIRAVSENNTGDYQCFVRNQYNGIGQSEVTRLILDQLCSPVTVSYNGFNITWNETQSGNVLEAPCTAQGLNGTVRRRCIVDDIWEEFFECFREETRMLFDQATNLSLSINELNETEIIAKSDTIASGLMNITTPTQEPIFAQDINLAVDIMTTLNNVTETVITNLTVNDTFFENTVSTINNLLSDTNQKSWEQLERTSPSTSQDLVRGAEQVTRLLSETLTNATAEEVIPRTNIVIKAERVSNDSVDEGYVFPDKNDNLATYTGGKSQLTITGGLLHNLGSKDLIIASTMITNSTGFRLSASGNKSLMPQVPGSPIFSLQINPSPDSNALEDNPIIMVFDIHPATAVLSEQNSKQNEQDIIIDNVSCTFYDYTLVTNNLNQIGGWSTGGVTVNRSNSNNTLVTCLTRHLTSFAVLVSIHPPSKADKALSIISYIGCSISLVCLCASIVMLSYTICKAKENGNHLFIHLNLCIALALGLVVFIAGIENATSNETACKFVAALLQYLFISAFCWMLCEGIMLYMMLVTVFGNKLNKRRFFFALGWGLAIPIVAISAGIVHRHYGTDQYCWIKSDDGAIAAFIAPIVAIMLINSLFLVITLKVLWQQKTIRKQGSSNRDRVKTLLKAVIILLPLLGITWIIGILAVNDDTEVFAWIFAILNSLQGVFILILHVIRNKQVARQVKKCYNSMRRDKVHSDNNTSSSTTRISSKTRTMQSIARKFRSHSKKKATTIESSTASGGYAMKNSSVISEDTYDTQWNINEIYMW